MWLSIVVLDIVKAMTKDNFVFLNSLAIVILTMGCRAYGKMDLLNYIEDTGGTQMLFFRSSCLIIFIFNKPVCFVLIRCVLFWIRYD